MKQWSVISSVSSCALEVVRTDKSYANHNIRCMNMSKLLARDPRCRVKNEIVARGERKYRRLFNVISVRQSNVGLCSREIGRILLNRRIAEGGVRPSYPGSYLTRFPPMTFVFVHCVRRFTTSFQPTDFICRSS